MYDHERYLELLTALEKARHGYYRLLWPDNSQRQKIVHITDLGELKIASRDFFAAKRALMSYLWEYVYDEDKVQVKPPTRADEETKRTEANYRIRGGFHFLDSLD